MAANLMAAKTTVGASDTFTLPEGLNTIEVFGTWDGQTVTLQTLAADGSTYISVGSNGELTADGQFSVKRAGRPTARLLIATAGTFSLNANINTNMAG